MKTLILSYNTGQGHNSCAQAIKEYYDRQGDECVIEDAWRFISKPFSDFLSRGHVVRGVNEPAGRVVFFRDHCLSFPFPFDALL